MLKIYNSLTSKIEQFIPINSRHINMYVCGPTVYGSIHVGNARPIIFFDMVRRYLEVLGYKVTYVSNITDLDDKVINEAIKYGVDEAVIANKYIEEYFQVTKMIGSKKPTISPLATNYIAEMILYINNLIQNDYAYEKNGNVYFRVNKVKTYGQLSNQTLEHLEEGARIEVDSLKENPKDFNLWKKTEIGIKYDSPWGKGRPGWHTECAVMNHEIFNGTIDIHGGGFDLKFPHHENERAQACAHNQSELANYWLHVGRLDLDKAKMSKSLGNVVLVKDLVKEYDLLGFRLLILAHHYRQPINFSLNLLAEYSNIMIKIRRSLKLAMIKLDLNNETLGETLENETLKDFKEKMDNDFDTPNIVSLIYELEKRINKESELEKLKMLINTLMMILEIIGLDFEIEKINPSDKKIYLDWQEARNQKNYELADKLRQALIDKGLV
ncbi:MAG: cysteine--tRNA ligase [Acholeplasmataceae bacterium]|jgi:cysteinyl-tRNA synthetase|nr:cysteine--tRNA ligase [Acholeplasmataceae bacterium]